MSSQGWWLAGAIGITALTAVFLTPRGSVTPPVVAAVNPTPAGTPAAPTLLLRLSHSGILRGDERLIYTDGRTVLKAEGFKEPVRPSLSPDRLQRISNLISSTGFFQLKPEYSQIAFRGSSHTVLEVWQSGQHHRVEGINVRVDAMEPLVEEVTRFIPGLSEKEQETLCQIPISPLQTSPAK